MFLENPLSTISGIERIEAKKLATLARHGYDFINEGNLQDFGRFMEWVRANYSDKLFDSDLVVKLYKTVTLGGFTVKAIKQMFDDYMNNLDAFTQVVEENPGRTAAWYRKQLKKRGVWVEED